MAYSKVDTKNTPFYCCRLSFPNTFSLKHFYLSTIQRYLFSVFSVIINKPKTDL